MALPVLLFVAINSYCFPHNLESTSSSPGQGQFIYSAESGAPQMISTTLMLTPT